MMSGTPGQISPQDGDCRSARALGRAFVEKRRAGRPTANLDAHFLPYFGKYPINAIAPIVVQGWVAKAVQGELSPRSVRTHHTLLHSIFKAAVRDRVIAYNPCEGTSLRLFPPAGTFAWGGRLADAASPELSAAVLESRDDGLDERGRTLVGWARCVGRDPNTITQDDVDQLRDVGYHDRQIHAVTTFVALRLAFSTVNDAVGRPARPATGREGAHCGAISGGVRPAHRTGPEHELTQADGPCEPGGALCVRHGDGVHYA